VRDGSSQRPVLAVGTVVVLLLLLSSAVTAFGAVGFGWSLVLAVLPAPLLVVFVRAIDRYEPEPPRLMALAFAWGASAAIVIASVLNLLGFAAGAVLIGPDAAEFFAAVIVAPFVEEAAKAAALGIIWWRHRREFNGVVDGIVYAALAGMGFAVVEDLFYYGEAWLQGTQEFTATVVVRGLLSPFAHSLFSALVGIGVALSLEVRRLRALPIVAGYAAAVFAHALWNGTALLGFLPLAYVGFFVPLFFGVVLVARWAMRHEGELLRRHLLPEVDAGLLHPATVEAFASVPARRDLLRRAAADGGEESRREVADVLHAAAELAFARHRISKHAHNDRETLEREQRCAHELRARLAGSAP
jgi:protease PrsW